LSSRAEGREKVRGEYRFEFARGTWEKVRGEYGLSSRAEVREKVRGEYGLSSLMKQNKKAKNYAVFCFAGKRIFFIYLRCDYMGKIKKKPC
jgi:hypothetical protein